MDSLIKIGAKYLIVVPVLIFAWLWIKQSRKNKTNLTWTVIIAGLIAGVLDKIGGHLYYDTRPFVSQHITPLIKHAADNGFPSEHTLLAAILAVVVSFYSRRMGLFLGLVAILVGAARVAAHVHSPIDIIGSLVMATVAGWLGKFIVSHWIAKTDDDRQ